MKDKLQIAYEITIASLIVVAIILMVALSKAWRNERFLDATLNKHTTTYNPTNK